MSEQPGTVQHPLDNQYTRWGHQSARTHPDSERRAVCPAMPVFTDPWGIEWQQVKCRRLTCPHCVHGHIRQIATAIARSRPGQMLTLTFQPEDRREARALLAPLRRRLRRLGTEMCASIERHGSGVPHIHVLMHGHRVTRSEAAAVAASLGLGLWNLVPYQVRSHGRDYLMKEARSDDTRARHLADNGGHLLATSTRGFWRDAATGEVFGGLTKAKGEARRTWVQQHCPQHRPAAPSPARAAHTLSRTQILPSRSERTTRDSGGSYVDSHRSAPAADTAGRSRSLERFIALRSSGGARRPDHDGATWTTRPAPSGGLGGVPDAAQRRSGGDALDPHGWFLTWVARPRQSAPSGSGGGRPHRAIPLSGRTMAARATTLARSTPEAGREVGAAQLAVRAQASQPQRRATAPSWWWCSPMSRWLFHFSTRSSGALGGSPRAALGSPVAATERNGGSHRGGPHGRYRGSRRASFTPLLGRFRRLSLRLRSEMAPVRAPPAHPCSPGTPVSHWCS